MLFARATANGFSGSGRADFWKEQVEDFCEALIDVLWSEHDPAPANLSGSTYKGKELAVEELGLTVYHIDKERQQIGIQVRFNSPSQEARAESRHKVNVDIVTDYKHLRKLIEDLSNLLGGAIKQLIVNDEPLL